jgi:hypothetical protein
MGSFIAVLYRLALEQPGLEVDTSAYHWSELSTYHAAVMLRLSFSWWYTLSVQLAVCVRKVSKSAATGVPFWLALAKVGRSAKSQMMWRQLAWASLLLLLISLLLLGEEPCTWLWCGGPQQDRQGG